ncbi:MAG: biotin/lipoyl-containing protein [Victivallaceae bacterium]|nr:biotin/lipoyl-containing protein [Victivallaceae bacterium]
MAKKISFMDTSFRDGFQSCLGARVKFEDYAPAIEAALAAGTRNFEIGGGAMFQSSYFYCQQDAFEVMDKIRKMVGPDVNLQTLSRGANVVGLVSQSRDIIDLHARMFAKHGVSTIRNFDALNDVRNVAFSGQCIKNAGVKHQITVTMMGLAPSLNENYVHTPQFYVDKLKSFLDAGVPFDSVAFKDASGTSTPHTVFETIKAARKLLGEDVMIQFHTHETAGQSVACNMAAIEGGANVLDLAMSPLSGGTCQADILVMWQKLRGTDYELDIDPDKILEAETIFEECLSKYFMPPEATMISPKIIFSPMPGGALTANTQMMRDNKCLDKFPATIEAMKECVAKGGFGTSVTPVSQFYFQQAFSNVMQGPWKKITTGYGNMVLGYFGKTPSAPDPEVVKIASEQLGKAPTTDDVHDINDRNPELGVKAATAKLEAAGLPVTDENVFITASCGDKGVDFLKGNKPLGIRYKEEEKPAAAKKSESGSYVVSVDGKNFNAQVGDDGKVTVNGKTFKVDVATGTAAAAAAPSAGGAAKDVVSPLPGTVMKIMAPAGTQIAKGDTILILEAMKQETPIVAENGGTVVQIMVEVGNVVAEGDVLASVEEK